MSPIHPLLPRQTLFGGATGTAVAPTTDPNAGAGDTTSNLWKYGIIVIVASFVVLTIVRTLILRHRMRVQRGFLTRASGGWSFPFGSTQAAPPYTAHPEGSDEERRRLRLESNEVRRALENAGLIFRPPTSRSAMTNEMDVLNGVNPEFETAEMRSRRQRRERRERRRLRRMEEEEGSGLPTYSRDKAEGEEILETAEGGLPTVRDVDSSDSEDEDMVAIPYELHPPAHPPHPITSTFVPPSSLLPPAPAPAP